MTLSNILLLASGTFGPKTRIIDGQTEIMALRGPSETRLNGQKGDMFSLIPVHSQVRGVTLTGLEYPLNDATIEIGSSLGISNVLPIKPRGSKYDRACCWA